MDRDSHLIWESVVNEMSAPFHHESQPIAAAFQAAHEQMNRAPTVPTPSGRGCTPGSKCDLLARNVRTMAQRDPNLAEEILRFEPGGPQSRMLEWSADIYLRDIEEKGFGGSGIDSPRGQAFPDSRTEMPASAQFQQRGHAS